MRGKKYIIASVVLVVIVILISIALTVERSDMLNTEKILVLEGETGNLYEIDDRKIIKEIVKYLVRDEKSGLDMDLGESFTYSLEFFTQNQGYGPLLCFKDVDICVFERETGGNYIKVDDKFFNLIEEGIDR